MDVSVELRECKATLNSEVEAITKQHETSLTELKETHSNDLSQQKTTMTKENEQSLKKGMRMTTNVCKKMFLIDRKKYKISVFV